MAPVSLIQSLYFAKIFWSWLVPQISIPSTSNGKVIKCPTKDCQGYIGYIGYILAVCTRSYSSQSKHGEDDHSGSIFVQPPCISWEDIYFALCYATSLQQFISILLQFCGSPMYSCPRWLTFATVPCYNPIHELCDHHNMLGGKPCSGPSSIYRSNLHLFNASVLKQSVNQKHHIKNDTVQRSHSPYWLNA
jgi:hypothetical protein